MFVKLVCLLFVVLVADAASLSGKCPNLTNLVEPDLEKLSGSWHGVGYYPEIPGSLLMQFNKDGAKYTVTHTYNETLTRSAPVEIGVDGENRKVFKLGEHTGVDTLYLLAAEYDKFAIIYACVSADKVHESAFVLARSKDVDEDTRKKIINVLQEYPGLGNLKTKFE